MSTTGGRDRARRLVLMVGVVVLGLAVALGIFIQYQSRDPRPPEDVARALAIPAVYATMGLLAIIGAFQRRPAIVVAAGVLCLVGTILSVATIEFAVPGVLLILLGSVVRPGLSVGAATLAAAHSDHDAGSLVQVAKFGEDEVNRFGTAEPSPQTTPT